MCERYFELMRDDTDTIIRVDFLFSNLEKLRCELCSGCTELHDTHPLLPTVGIAKCEKVQTLTW